MLCTLESRLCGLPDDFVLAVRGRKLIGYGQVSRVVPGKDLSPSLSVRARAGSIHSSRGSISSASSGAHSSASSSPWDFTVLSPSTCRTSAFSVSSASSGYPPSRSNSFTQSSPSRPGVTRSPSSSSSVSSEHRPNTPSKSRRKDEALTMFIFDDLVLVATTIHDKGGLFTKKKGDKANLRVLSEAEGGIGKVLEVRDWCGWQGACISRSSPWLIADLRIRPFHPLRIDDGPPLLHRPKSTGGWPRHHSLYPTPGQLIPPGIIHPPHMPRPQHDTSIPDNFGASDIGSHQHALLRVQDGRKSERAGEHWRVHRMAVWPNGICTMTSSRASGRSGRLALVASRLRYTIVRFLLHACKTHRCMCATSGVPSRDYAKSSLHTPFQYHVDHVDHVDHVYFSLAPDIRHEPLSLSQRVFKRSEGVNAHYGP